MKTIKYLLLFSVFTIACDEKKAHIQVQNNISQVVIEDVRWGDIFIDSRLFPGETSSKKRIRETSTIELPYSGTISFRMKANNQVIFLETEETFTLDEEDDILVVLSDSTLVRNPNE